MANLNDPMKRFLRIMLVIAGLLLAVCLAALVYSYLVPPHPAPATPTEQPRREIRQREQVLYDSITLLNRQLQAQDSTAQLQQLAYQLHRQQIAYYQKQLYEATLHNSIVLQHLPAYTSDSIARYFATEWGEK